VSESGGITKINKMKPQGKKEESEKERRRAGIKKKEIRTILRHSGEVKLKETQQKQ
jgi:hypothetical protein